jgi:hypothetical protein
MHAGGCQTPRCHCQQALRQPFTRARQNNDTTTVITKMMNKMLRE